MANDIQTVANDLTENVLAKVNEMEKRGKIAFPPHYSYANALKAAQLVLLETKKDNKPVLEVCSKGSIVNALLGMVTKGLNIQKGQCYFIPYGNQLTLSVSYMGKIAMAKRIGWIKDVKAYPLYKGDTFETVFDPETGTLKVKEYAPKFENIDENKLIGAFAMVIGKDGVLHTEVMNMTQIRKAWEQGAAKGNSGAHKNFGEEMAKKTVINRAIKLFINTSDDSNLDLDDDMPESTYIDAEVREVDEDVNEAANSELIDLPEETGTLSEPKEENKPQKPEIDPGF